MLITLIAAVGTNRVIGHAGGIPWHIPEDFRFFKKATTGCPCIMGRRTFESLPKALPNRLNLVLTTDPESVDTEPANVAAYTSAHTALIDAWEYAELNEAPRIIIMGGERIYRRYLPVAHELLLTQVDYDGPGDTHFPEIAQDDWTRIEGMTLAPNAEVERYQRRLPDTLLSLHP